MIPQDKLSDPPAPAVFLPPRDRWRDLLVDYENGGVALNDPSEGLNVRVWRCQFIDGDFVIDSPPDVAPIVAYTPTVPAVELGLAFDQNMQPFLVWIDEEGDAYFRWFDPTIPGFDVVQLPSGTITPRCVLDDKRDFAGPLGLSDVILTYMREGSLYFRQQRDRFATEYELASGYEGWQLGQFGMNRRLRLQWQLVPIPPEEQ